ncbi:hypothetical protein AKJ16_DCAP09551 [Drosera capensis]
MLIVMRRISFQTDNRERELKTSSPQQLPNLLSPTPSASSPIMALSSTQFCTALSTLPPPAARLTLSSSRKDTGGPPTLVSFPKPAATPSPASPRLRCFARRQSSSSTPTRPRADEALVSNIEKELRSVMEEENLDEDSTYRDSALKIVLVCISLCTYLSAALKIPEGFPFKIEDNPGQKIIRLKRQFSGGESIVVEVSMPQVNPSFLDGFKDENEEDEDEDQNEEEDGDDGDEGEHGADDNDEDKGVFGIPLVVMVSKRNSPTLEFACTAYLDEVSIDSVALRSSGINDVEEEEEDIDVEDTEDDYQGPDFRNDLDENLQKAFRKYLKVRGIKNSITEFLYEYMTNKESKEYFRCLNGMKKRFQQSNSLSWM